MTKSRNPAGLELAILGLWLAGNALERLSVLNPGPCRCRPADGFECRACDLRDIADYAKGILFNVGMASSVLTTEAYALPRGMKQLESFLKDGWLKLDADRLARYLLRTGADQAAARQEDRGGAT